ncbi:MAG: hypothetical protein LWX11_06175 [Firmicutes bacterium]|nr:hypothetical protein [Bacillota bacterium]
MLIEAGLVNQAQLQEALRHQRIAGGRMGSILVALGFVDEEVLMDFLAYQTGVPRLDARSLEVPLEVLKSLPRKLAEQLVVLPVEFREPRSLILAMVDPSDLNAVDSVRFASGRHVEPVVASHSALKQAIASQYDRLDQYLALEEGDTLVEGLPVPADYITGGVEPLPVIPHTSPGKYARDPFFEGSVPNEILTPAPNPFAMFSEDREATKPHAEADLVIHDRASVVVQARRMETFQTRNLVMGLIKLLQRRGILGEDELQRYLVNLLESGEIKETERDD